MNKFYTCLLFVTGILLPSFLLAQEQPAMEEPPEMITDRPDQTESAAIVPQGFLQFETGPVLFTEGADVREWSYNTLLLRVGILRWLELRFVGSYDGFRYALDGGELDGKGLAPLMLGTKVALWQEQGAIPKTALMYHITLPATGSREFRIDDPAHELRANFEHTLSEELTLSYNLGAAWQEIKEAEGLYTLSLGYSLSEKVGLFAEVFGAIPQEVENEHSLDGGITYLLRPNFQLDAYLGRGISSSAPDWMVGGGFSWRIPR